MKMNHQKGGRALRRFWQAAFMFLLALILISEAAPALTVRAVYLAAESVSTAAGEAGRKVENYVLAAKDSTMKVAPGTAVAIRHGSEEHMTFSRENESIRDLLAREGVSVGPMELIRVSGDDSLLLEIASDFTVYETVSTDVAYTTVYEADYTLPKGETRVKREGEMGTHEVTYEVVYADGRPMSRQAVSDGGKEPVSKVIGVGSLVPAAQEGDTIKEVITLEDGSGYLLMNSGDSLHFNSAMNVTCTAYTSNVGKVGTITYTGTTVHVGVVAVDKSVIPLGTNMFITTADGGYTYGMGHAEDTGVRGSTVDLFMNTYDECMNFGRKSSVVYLLDSPEVS